MCLDYLCDESVSNNMNSQTTAWDSSIPAQVNGSFVQSQSIDPGFGVPVQTVISSQPTYITSPDISLSSTITTNDMGHQIQTSQITTSSSTNMGYSGNMGQSSFNTSSF